MRALGPALLLAATFVAPSAHALGPAEPPPPPTSAPRAGEGATKSTAPPSTPPAGKPGTTTGGGTPPLPGSIPPAPPKSGGSTEPAAEEVEGPPVDLSDTWTYNRGAERPRYIRSGELVEVAPNPEGYYSGVSIDGNHVPPFPARALGKKPALLTWTGFERTGGGSRVFFELSSDVDTKLDIRGSVLTLRMANTRINVRNNARYLDLRWFRTPVRSIKVGRRGKDTIATIVLKREATPTIVVMEGKSGYRLLVVEFAGPTEAAEPPIEAP